MSTATDGFPRTLLILLAALLLVPPLLVVLAMPLAGMGMMGGGMGGAVVPGVALLAWLVTVGLFLAVAYVVYRAVAGSAAWSPAGARDPALEELRLAYARGDLTREEFVERRDMLERGEGFGEESQ